MLLASFGSADGFDGRLAPVWLYQLSWPVLAVLTDLGAVQPCLVLAVAGQRDRLGHAPEEAQCSQARVGDADIAAEKVRQSSPEAIAQQLLLLAQTLQHLLRRQPPAHSCGTHVTDMHGQHEVQSPAMLMATG